MSLVTGTRQGGRNHGVQGWQQPVAHPDNNSSGGTMNPGSSIQSQSKSHQSRRHSESSSEHPIETQQQNSLQDTGCEQDRQFLHIDTVNGILASRTAMESMPISSQEVQLRTYVNDTLFHMVKFIESTSMLEEIIMPIVLKGFGLSEGENMSSSWAVRTRKGVCSFLSTKRSNVTVDLKTVFEKSKWLRHEDFVTTGVY
jgi:hypothetical protein